MSDRNAKRRGTSALNENGNRALTRARLRNRPGAPDFTRAPTQKLPVVVGFVGQRSGSQI